MSPSILKPLPRADDVARHDRPSSGATFGALALFAVLAVVHLWPLATAPGTLSRNDNGDAVLHEWIMSWVAHQVVVDPRHLFDANIFFPERGTLAYSDHLFLQSMLGAPLRWAGATPVLVHNLVLMAGFALTGWTTSLVMRRWTGSWLAAIASGSLVAFNSFSLTRLPQIQDLHFEFFPLTLLALDRLLETPRMRHALSLALWFVLQSLTGTYLMVFTSLSLIAGALARPSDWFGRRLGTLATYVAIAAALSVVALTPFLLPYYHASADVGLVRSLEDTRRYSAELTDYLAAAGRIHFDVLKWSRPYFKGDALFPGFIALALAAIGVEASGRSDLRVRMLIAIAIVSFALSFGPSFAPYRVVYRVYPLLTGIRGAVRFGQFTLAAIGMLAGFGVAALQKRWRPSLAVPLCAGLVVAVNAEAARAPMGYTRFDGIPPIYDRLSQLGSHAVLAFFPFYGSAQFHENARFMLATTNAWQPMLNGYSGFKPASYYKHVAKLAAFPDQASIDYLLGLGVTHVVVDRASMRPSQLAALPDFPELHLWQTDGTVGIYLLTGR